MSELICDPDPKSINWISWLGLRRLTRMFSSLISRWMTPRSWQARTVSTTWRRNLRAKSSSRAPISIINMNSVFSSPCLYTSNSLILLSPIKKVSKVEKSLKKLALTCTFFCDEIEEVLANEGPLHDKDVRIWTFVEV